MFITFITGVHGCIMSRESNASGRGCDAMDVAAEAVLARWMTVLPTDSKIEQ
jgi:hypothetical protein